MENKFKYIKIIAIIIMIILLVPLPMRLKDGGSIRFQSVLYSVTKINRLNEDINSENIRGWEVEVFNMKVYSNIKE